VKAVSEIERVNSRSIVTSEKPLLEMSENRFRNRMSESHSNAL
jgi:hypothetical protein